MVKPIKLSAKFGSKGDKVGQRGQVAMKKFFKVSDLKAGHAVSLADLKKNWKKPAEGAAPILYFIPSNDEWIDFKDETFLTRKVTQEAIDDLADSIKKDKQIQPIEVRLSSDHPKLQITLGQTRARACRKLGIPIAVIITNDPVEVCVVRAINENLRRTDMPDADLINNYLKLKEAGHTVEQIASDFGKSTSYIHKILKIKDHQIVFEALGKNEINLSGARELVSATEKENLSRENITKVISALKDGIVNASGVAFYVEQLLHGVQPPAVPKVNQPKSSATPEDSKKDSKPLFQYVPGGSFSFAAKGHSFRTPLDDMKKIKASYDEFGTILSKIIKDKEEGV